MVTHSNKIRAWIISRGSSVAACLLISEYFIIHG